VQTTFELYFGEAYFESCDFSRKNTNIDVSVFMFDLRMINMSSHSCIVNRLRRYRKQTGNINPHSLRRSRITYSILAYPWA
jgi:integrase